MNAGQRQLSDDLCERMRKGTAWLTAQHGLWAAGKEHAATDTEFSHGMALWFDLEDSLRQIAGDERCVYRDRCPEGSPVKCRGCVGALL